MSKIVILGWGSLIWNPKELLFDGKWNTDGPLICVEFARQSQDGRITLVLTESESPVQSLWTRSTYNNHLEAIENLRIREGVLHKNIQKHIGFWEIGNPSPDLIPNLAEWAEPKNISHVIWTNLPPKFNDLELIPTSDQLLEYFTKLEGNKLELAKEYVCKTPAQISTPVRTRVEHLLGWKPISS